MAPHAPLTAQSSSGASERITAYKPIAFAERVAPNPFTERKKAAKNVKRLNAIFKGSYFSSVGQIEINGKLLSADDIACYVTVLGGTYEKQVTTNTTHLVCTIKEYQNKHPQGMLRLELPL